MDYEKQEEMHLLSEEIQKFQTYVQSIEEQLSEVNFSINAIDEFSDVSIDDEMFSPLTNGIFAKVSLKNSSSLLVNVGGGVLVEKTLSEAKLLLSNQLSEMESYYEQIMVQIQNLYQRYVELQMQING